MDSFQITVKISEQKKMLARVEIKFGDIKIRGFRIMTSDVGDGIFLTPPSIPPRYYQIVYIENKELWSKIQDKALSEYYKAKEAYDLETIDIDLKDIPI